MLVVTPYLIYLTNFPGNCHIYDLNSGKKREEYVRWIQNSQIWGGGIELAALARHFATGKFCY